ncbi:hypothetical protein JCM8097_003593 [Rhodosporidiobolus ruineniae]
MDAPLLTYAQSTALFPFTADPSALVRSRSISTSSSSSSGPLPPRYASPPPPSYAKHHATASLPQYILDDLCVRSGETPQQAYSRWAASHSKFATQRADMALEDAEHRLSRIRACRTQQDTGVYIYSEMPNASKWIQLQAPLPTIAFEEISELAEATAAFACYAAESVREAECRSVAVRRWMGLPGEEGEDLFGEAKERIERSVPQVEEALVMYREAMELSTRWFTPLQRFVSSSYFEVPSLALIGLCFFGGLGWTIFCSVKGVPSFIEYAHSHPAFLAAAASALLAYNGTDPTNSDLRVHVPASTSLDYAAMVEDRQAISGCGILAMLFSAVFFAFGHYAFAWGQKAVHTQRKAQWALNRMQRRREELEKAVRWDEALGSWHEDVDSEEEED